MDGHHYEPGFLRHPFGTPLHADVSLSGQHAGWTAADSGNRRGAGCAHCAHQFSGKAGDAGSYRFVGHRAAHARTAGHGRRFRRHVSRRGRAEGVDHRGQPGAIGKVEAGRDAGDRVAGGRAAAAHCRHFAGFLEPVGHYLHRARAVPAVVERRCGGRVPRLSGAGRGGRGRQGPHSGSLRARTPALRPFE